MRSIVKEDVEEGGREVRKEKVREGMLRLLSNTVEKERAKENPIWKFCYKVSLHWSFTAFISLCIVINTIVLALDKYPEDKLEAKNLEALNLGLSCIFFVEMVVKLIGLGVKQYFKDSFNTFDCAIVVISIIDIVLTFADLKLSATGAISAMRAFRLLRVFKLAKSWRKFRYLLKTIGTTIKDISTFSILLFLFIFTYTILGMETFAHKAKFQDG